MNVKFRISRTLIILNTFAKIHINVQNLLEVKAKIVIISATQKRRAGTATQNPDKPAPLRVI